jgi:hypothetical protein
MQELRGQRFAEKGRSGGEMPALQGNGIAVSQQVLATSLIAPDAINKRA